MDEITIRRFAAEDATPLAALMTELGYPTEPQAMIARMERIARHPDHATFLAVNGAEIIGMVGAYITLSYEHDVPIGRITGLIVTGRVQGMGVGSRLLTAAEDWVRERGAGQMSLTSHLRREAAHAFYERRGYEVTGKRFVRRFSPGES